MRSASGGGGNVTNHESAPAGAANVSARRYTWITGADPVPSHPISSMTFTATTDQHLKAEMAIRFKAIKLGATATQVNLWTLNEVFIFISNHA